MSEIVFDAYIRLIKNEFSQLEADDDREQALQKLRDILEELELIPLISADSTTLQYT